MNCALARQHWELYLDSEGSAELHSQIRRHLGGCPDCAAWFSRQQCFERELSQALSAGDRTPELWERVVARSGVERRPARSLPILVAVGGVAAAIAIIVAALAFQGPDQMRLGELARDAAGWHAQWQAGRVRPELMSRSREEVEDFLRTKTVLRWHWPPEQPGGFQVRGAGVRQVGGLEAPYIVGLLGDAPVSILVLDKANVLQDDATAYRHGDYHVAAGVVADNVAVVTGTSSPAALQRLLEQLRQLAIAPDDFPRS